jgi:5-methyltetrahydrofolate--homocysteine methyltransferase
MAGTSSGKSSTLGKVIIGTVKDDIHDIGKDIVAFMLDVNGFEVHDLGINVPADEFVSKVKEVNPDIVALSGLLTLIFDHMKETVNALEKAGLRENVKVMIGGCQMDEDIVRYIGADAYRPDAVSGVKLAKEWVGGK